ncbi:unnamed protein product [Owenia fusiformis]|uniref:Uncharacterized protein n=1 Tax=Owenia fusiformis TaxID=6347 RepID=A0A8J1Y6S0_OWEFU|nr:unnamed protein product [Owenia fusiformis]
MNTATVPTPVQDVQGDNRWMSMHNRFVAQGKRREVEVLFIGDSLVQQLQFSPVWEKMFVPLHCLNFGIGKDETQHVLWRLQNGELDSLSPKVVVLLVGTNNHDHSADQVVEGILAIVNTIEEKQPEAQTVVVGIPPRGQNPNKLREKITKINQSLASKLSNEPRAVFVNVDAGLFVNSDGEISHRDMYDYLHFTAQGYQKLCEPILEEVQNLLKTFVKVESTSFDEGRDLN